MEQLTTPTPNQTGPAPDQAAAPAAPVSQTPEDMEGVQAPENV